MSHDASNDRKKLTTRVPLPLAEEVEQIAIDESEPGNRLDISNVVRAAIRDYVDRHGSDECRDPKTEGGIIVEPVAAEAEVPDS